MHLRHIEPATRAGGPGNIDIRPERAFRRFPPPSPAGTCAERGRARARAHRDVERWVERKRPTAQHNLSARKKSLHGEATGAEGRQPLLTRGRGDRGKKPSGPHSVARETSPRWAATSRGRGSEPRRRAGRANPAPERPARPHFPDQPILAGRTQDAQKELGRPWPRARADAFAPLSNGSCHCSRTAADNLQAVAPSSSTA